MNEIKTGQTWKHVYGHDYKAVTRIEIIDSEHQGFWNVSVLSGRYQGQFLKFSERFIRQFFTQEK